jgi:acyl-CoA thioesterase-1
MDIVETNHEGIHMQPGTSHRYGMLRRVVKLCAVLVVVGISYGVRAAPDDAVHILALGDSLTAGYGLEPGQSFPARLQKSLTDTGLKATVHNAGVSGDTASGGLSRLDWALAGVPGGKPDLAIVELGANDALRGIDPQVTVKALTAILARFKKAGVPVILAGMKAPPNMGAAYVKQFDGIYAALAKQFGVPLYPFFLEGVIGHKALLQADAMHPTAKGVDVIVTGIAPMVHSQLKRPAGR